MSEKEIPHRVWVNPQAYKVDQLMHDMRGISKHVIIHSMIQNDVSEDGTVHVYVPDDMRKNHPIAVSKGYETTLYGQNTSFSRECYGPAGGDDQALSFWLAPEAMDEQFEDKLEAFAMALASHHGIDPLEIKYVVPPETTLAKFDIPVGCGVAIATSAEHAEDLKRVMATIKREHIAAELPVTPPVSPLRLPAPKPAFSWQARMEEAGKSQRKTLAISDILRDSHDADLLIAEVTKKAICFDFSASTMLELGQSLGPERIESHHQDIPQLQSAHNTHALVMLMKHDFFNFRAHGGTSYEASAVEPATHAFQAALSEKYGIPIHAAFVALEPHFGHIIDSPHPKSAIVLMTDSAHQNVLMSDVRLDIMREFKKLSDGTYGHPTDELDNRRNTSQQR